MKVHSLIGLLCRPAVLGLILLFLAPGCSVRKLAVNKLADALSSSGGGFASDDDPELVRGAVPFSLKLMESILAETPSHTGLLTASASGFTQYAFAFVQQDADELEARDLAAAEALRARAKRLYVRARNHGLKGLESRHAGFEKALRASPAEAVRKAVKADVPLLYWTAAAWGSAISLSKDNPALVAEVPVVEALIDRALELDEAFDEGALHAFLVTYEMSRTKVAGDPAERSRRHLNRALELSGGRQAGPLVSFAEAVTIQKQDVKEFEALLKRALAIDADADPAHRLVNLIMQRRARWLLAQKDDLFLPAVP
jgi:predicted anti-sigma-YlaC factor YlaD